MPEPKPIDLALQGGGAHGAFTWGVLDRLLADDRLRIEAISGTSAGAMNAVVLADGMNRGGREGARAALERFWRAVSRAAMASPIRRSPLDVLLGRWSLDASPGFLAFDWLTRAVSPYEFNPFDINPLRDLLVEQVDFDSVRCCTAVKLFIAATNVRSGQARVFRGPEVTADAVMASACLPFLYRAVEIDGEAYWDGGYMGNPVLFPLIDECAARDLVIVQINPIRREEVPRRAQDIQNRLNEITFNASLIRELRSLMLLQALVDEEGTNRSKSRDVLLHRIEGEDALRGLGVSSKLNAEWAFLRHLHGIGWARAEAWLEASYDRLGETSTFDPAALLA
ncbi:patatin-like phospholipase family protein [Rubellimicrobium sp. CFH 75288]|uniref:patatin-like phospholipase family protein n=1 Tax=Rubellimicrobium sp. CFH 75288 TaxID=2697034 RepID=UPI001412E176|nr:patatin-like phospholipase family protein [Rubellimicrobium sp. CFH 75288]NAZ35677.1 patatin-like phospholipase family protein [Rubellimicrobium sp. CFH 75288]